MSRGVPERRRVEVGQSDGERDRREVRPMGSRYERRRGP